MSQRPSGYERKDGDCYETPAWVTQALIPHLGPSRLAWEPAAGSGKMVQALREAGYAVEQSDIADGCDFLAAPALHSADLIGHQPAILTCAGVH